MNTDLEQIHTELQLAEERWENHNITDYDIDAQGFVHPVACGNDENPFGPTHLKIRQGEIIFENENQRDAEKWCEISSFLPPKVFDSVRYLYVFRRNGTLGYVN